MRLHSFVPILIDRQQVSVWTRRCGGHLGFRVIAQRTNGCAIDTISLVAKSRPRTHYAVPH